ncbi:MAG: alpha/beta fold hydrolase [Bacteroidia bacterium]|nr:alpha/beta fold hydrolase [Bacteroidia bacterium]
MKLFFREYGAGKPAIILHGLFGMSDNWMTMAKRLSENDFHVITPDLRNHGQSPHSEEWDYVWMADDVFELMDAEKIINPVVIGHSLGGKVAMQMVSKQQEKFSGIVVADIAPKKYPVMHGSILSALRELNLQSLSSRKEAEQILSQKITDNATLQFLMKNIFRKDVNEKKLLSWRFNLEVISEKIDAIGNEIMFRSPVELPAMFIRGERSDYVTDSDFLTVKKAFPAAELITIKNSGHWIHAEQPDNFFTIVSEFLNTFS